MADAIELVSAPVPAPAPEPAPSTPEPSQAPSQEFELPDGSKVGAEELSKQWRDNFMPQFTRKSQELAAIKAKSTPEPTMDDRGPWKQPEWNPQTYDELAKPIIQQAQEAVWQKIQYEADRANREAEERQAYVQQETEQLKGLDSKVDVNRVMAHAAKYSFPSLIPAYQNMKAIEDAEKRVEERVIKNLKLRSGEPVGTGNAAANPGSFPSDVRTGLEKARYIIRNQK